MFSSILRFQFCWLAEKNVLSGPQTYIFSSSDMYWLFAPVYIDVQGNRKSCDRKHQPVITTSFQKMLFFASSSRFSAHHPESIESSAKLSTVTETSACRRSRLPGPSDVPDPLGPHPSHHGQDRTEHGGLELANGGQAGRSLWGSGCCGALRRREEEGGAARPGQLEGEVWLLAFVCGVRDWPRECLEVSLSVRQERWR